MTRSVFRMLRNAGILGCAVLIATSSALAQQVVRSTNSVQSVISLAPSLHPQGTFLARHASDSKFENLPANYHVFAASGVGEDASVESLQLNFAGETTLTSLKMSNKDFVIQPGGSCYAGNHYNRGDSCTLLVRFTPQGPGHRLGFLKVANSADTAEAYVGLTGNGYAPVINFWPSTITTVPATVTGAGAGVISGGTHMAIDGGDILYIADIGNNKLREIDSTGVMNTVNIAFSTPDAIAVDDAGIIYSTNIPSSTYYFSDFTPWGVQTAFGYTYTSTTCTVSAPCAFSAVGMGNPANLSIDNSNNLFFLEGTTGSAEMPVSNVGAGVGTLNLWHLKNQFAYASGGPGSFAVDAYGDLYTDYTYTPNNTCVIYEENLYNAEYSPTATRVAGSVKCGFSGDGGQARGAQISTKIAQMAFDTAGNLYFVDQGNQRVRRIDAVTGIIRTIAGNGANGYSGDGSWAIGAHLSNPTGLAVDSQGQVYILSGDGKGGAAQVVRQVTPLGRQAFNSTTTGKTAPALQVVVNNNGNSSMLLAGTLFTGANSADFKVDVLTTTCNLSTGGTLGAGQTCYIGFTFAPTVAGYKTAYFNMRTNTVAGLNQIQLTGVAVAPAVVKFASPTANSVVVANSSLTVKVGVTSSYSAAPTGTVTFKVDGVQVGSPVSVVSGAATLPVKSLAAGSHTLVATYSGDKYTAASSASVTVSARAAATSN